MQKNPPQPNSSRPKPRPRQPSPDADLAPTPAKRTCLSPKQEKLSVVKRYQPPKSFNDPNEYRILELSNGLTVALVSRRRPNPISTSSSSLKTSSAPSYHPFFVPNTGENGFSYNMEAACSYLPPEQFNVEISPNGNCRDTGILKCEPTPSPKVDIFGDARSLHTPYRLPVPMPSNDESLGCDGGKNGSLLRMDDEPATTPPSFTNIALVVNVGGASDPINCQGLAHFTEHMVHHGSKRHPQEDSQTLLLMNFGNLCNAETRHQRTTYYHEIMDDLLDKSLDIFSDMLSYPLFEEEHLDREVNAVDNEFHFRRDRNSRDIWMLPFHVTVNENHPLSKFLCGSIETLGNGARVRRFMREFHTEHYVAPAMTACLNSTKSLDELETLALDHFSRFLEGERNTFQKMWNKCEPVVWRNCDKKVVLQGITKSAMLDFWWHLPASLFTEEPNEMILEMILAMLTDTSDKSLRHNLQHMGLVWDQRFSRLDTSYAAFIRISFHLTEKGRANTSEIFQATFQFLEKLQTTSESDMRRLFEELRWKNQRQFHFGTQYSSLYHTIQLATALQFVSDKQELVTYGSWANARFNYGRIIKSLQHFRDENLIVLEIIPKGFSIEDWAASKNYTDFKVERAPHTNTPYLLVPRKDDNFAANMDNAAIPSQFNFGFIPVNNFLLEDMKLQQGRGDGDASMHPPINYGGIQPQNLKCRGSDNEAFPRILGNHMGHMSESYSPYLANVSVYFCSSTVFTNPRNHILAYLWKFCMNYNHKVNQTALGMGGFDVSFLFNNDGIHIDVVGFPKHMSKVVDTAIASMLKNPISENDFWLAKECLKVNIESLLGNNDVLDRTVYECTIYQNEEMFLDSLHHVESLTFQDLQNYMMLFKRTTYAHVILKGNVPVDVFHSVAKSLGQYEFFPYLGNPMEYHQRDPVLKPLFPFGEKCIRVKSECMSGFCTSVNNCYILGPINNDQANCLLSALDFMDCQAFLYLRTKHQLGYSVCVSRKEFLLPNVLMFSVKVMATAKKFSPCELDIKIDEFLAYYCDYLKTITEEQFETMRKLKNISPDVSLQDVSRCFNSFFGPTTKHKYEGCEKGFAVRDYKNKCFWREIRKLSIQVVGNEEKNCDCDVCQSISGWRPGPEIESKLRFATGSGSTSSYFVDYFPRFS
ncbi:Zinc-metallopeptidase, peroxisomal [Orchesella cincta]|uniref:Zinc-metallopeptidase, peroxisomal n=1 Tax=Orchesella cincta TaxID=48709 RepID=A0A1D2N825_ORCCI|nr:Zinc-metallopeptidase, peroxisomal [Orchesella cincta]